MTGICQGEFIEDHAHRAQVRTHVRKYIAYVCNVRTMGHVAVAPGARYSCQPGVVPALTTLVPEA